MRRLVDPSPSTKCELCGGNLLLKRLELDAPIIELDVALYVCEKCGREQAYMSSHDPYAVRTRRR
jgi:DNA-directed RNA polymerase subunit RPC12/RpoP